jgi:hypothetical protein
LYARHKHGLLSGKEDPASIEIKVRHSFNIRHNWLIVPANDPSHEVCSPESIFGSLIEETNPQVVSYTWRLTHRASCFKAAI